MIYAVSDLHGYPPERFLELLGRASFSPEDFLFVLGDVIDRNGDGGIAVLRWMMKQPNVRLIKGNHEAMLLSCAFLFTEITDESAGRITDEKIGLVSNYMYNGGDVTLKELSRLRSEYPDEVTDILSYIRFSPLYDGVTAGGRDFILVHGGLGNFSPDRKLKDYSADELLWTTPAPGDEYYDGVITVLGHTPTGLFGPEHSGRIYKTRTWIDIDAGAASGNEPVLLRLDDMAEFRNTPV